MNNSYSNGRSPHLAPAWETGDPEACVLPAAAVDRVVPQRHSAPDPEVRPRSGRRRFTRAYKLGILQEADKSRAYGQVSSLLRREGLYSSHLVAWRKQLADAPKRRGRRPLDPVLAEQLEVNRKLVRENQRLERRLVQAEAIIDIQKKVSTLLGIALSSPGSEGSD